MILYEKEEAHTSSNHMVATMMVDMMQVLEYSPSFSLVYFPSCSLSLSAVHTNPTLSYSSIPVINPISRLNRNDAESSHAFDIAQHGHIPAGGLP